MQYLAAECAKNPARFSAYASVSMHDPVRGTSAHFPNTEADVPDVPGSSRTGSHACHQGTRHVRCHHQ